MQLIERYLAEVGENLPRKNRGDILAEIRSNLEDALESRSQAAGREADEEMVVDVLKAYGKPEKVAQGYQEPRYLIGPRLYPIFWLVVRIVLSVLVILSAVRFGIALASEPAVDLAVKTIADLGAGCLSALGNIVFIFAILELTLPKWKEKDDEDWDPRTLKAVEIDGRINVAGSIVEIVLGLVALLVFNFYPNLLVIAYTRDGAWITTPLFTEAFFRYVPFMSIIWIAEIIKNILLLRQRVFSPGLRWYAIGVSIASLVLIGMIISGPAIINVQSFNIRDVQTMQTLSTLMDSIVRGALVIALVVEAIELITTIVKMFRKDDGPIFEKRA